MTGQLALQAVPAAWPAVVSPWARAVAAFRHADTRHGETAAEITRPPTFWPHDADPAGAGSSGKSLK